MSTEVQLFGKTIINPDEGIVTREELIERLQGAVAWPDTDVREIEHPVAKVGSRVKLDAFGKTYYGHIFRIGGNKCAIYTDDSFNCWNHPVTVERAGAITREELNSMTSMSPVTVVQK